MQVSEHKNVVLCAVSLYRDAKGRDRDRFGKMVVVDDASAKSIDRFL